MSKAKILVVDDDRLVLATVSNGLKHAGYTVESASGGKDALEMIEKGEFDLVMLDIRMPDVSGIDVSARLRAEGVPFLVLSAYSDAAAVDALVENGALSYLVKPIDVQKMIPAIEAALHRAEQIARSCASEKRLQLLLSREQSVSKAIGILMERHKLSGDDAFDLLRKHARSKRRKLVEVAGELLVAENTLNDLAPNPVLRKG